MLQEYIGASLIPICFNMKNNEALKFFKLIEGHYALKEEASFHVRGVVQCKGQANFDSVGITMDHTCSKVAFKLNVETLVI